MATALRCLVHTNSLTKLKKLTKSRTTSLLLNANNTQVQIRCINRRTEPLVTNLDLSNVTDFEKSNNPKEWHYVERCLPLKVVPTPKQFDGFAPSGWIPSKEVISHVYFVPRTKNYMIPVYLNISYRGSRHITIIKKIEGNIWDLEKELKAYLESKSKKYYKNIASQVNEMTRQIRFRGDHIEYVKQWLISKGF